MSGLDGDGQADSGEVEAEGLTAMIYQAVEKVQVGDKWLVRFVPECAPCTDIEQMTIVTTLDAPLDTYDIHIQRVVPA